MGASLLAYPTDKDGYANLCSFANKRESAHRKSKCELYKEDVYEFAKDMQFIAVPPASLNDSFDLNDDFKTT
jgi:error-prone DNA polymerase